MATDTASFPAEIEALTAPLVASGKFANTSEVVRAAIEALREQLDEQAYDEACVRAAEEGEASGLYDGDPFERIRAKYGWKTRFAE